MNLGSSLVSHLQASGSFLISSWVHSMEWLTVLRITPEVSSDATETLDQSLVCGGADRTGNVCTERQRVLNKRVLNGSLGVFRPAQVSELEVQAWLHATGNAFCMLKRSQSHDSWATETLPAQLTSSETVWRDTLWSKSAWITWRCCSAPNKHFLVDCSGLLSGTIPLGNVRSPQTEPAGSAQRSSCSAQLSPPPAPSGGSELCAQSLSDSSRSSGAKGKSIMKVSNAEIKSHDPQINDSWSVAVWAPPASAEFTSRTSAWQRSTLEISLEKLQTTPSVSLSAAAWVIQDDRNVLLVSSFC